MSKNCANCRHWSKYNAAGNEMHECLGPELLYRDIKSADAPVPTITASVQDDQGLWVSYYTPAAHFCSLHKEF